MLNKLAEKRPKDPLEEILLQNLQDHSEISNLKAFKQYQKSELVFSQFNMSMVHMAFFEEVVMFPKEVKWKTKIELCDLVSSKVHSK